MRAPQERLEASLIEQACDGRDVALPSPQRHSDRSLLLSAWQKAIRRGDAVIACRCGLGLHDLDPAATWRRLRVIALEDVGIANVSLVAQVLAVAGKSQLRRRVGSPELLVGLVRRLAGACKSRTACDLLCWGTRVDVQADAWREWLLPHPVLPGAAGLLPRMAGLSIRANGGWLTVHRAHADVRNGWLAALDLPPVVDYMFRRGGSTGGLNLAAVLAWQLAQGRGSEACPGKPPPIARSSISGVPAYAWCVYTGPGREALRAFIAGPDPLAGALRRCTDQPALALGHLVFHAEGDWCRRTWAFPGSAPIARAAERSTLAACGLAMSAVPALEAEVSAALPRLHAVRRLVAQRHGWGSGGVT